LNELQTYFIASNFTFWTLFYKYRPLLDPSCWLPPFKGKTVATTVTHHTSEES